jgi:hypothetical protein
MIYEEVFKPKVGGALYNPFVIRNPIERIKDYKKEAERLVYGNSDYNTKSKNTLKEVGDAKVFGAKLYRTPVPDYLIEILNVVSLGDFKKKLKDTEYDKLFHLGIILETSKGRVLIEKNEVINVSKSIPSKTEGYEEKEVTLHNHNLTVQEVLDNTQRVLQDRFFKYSAYDNNCQNFILSLLKANNIGSEKDKEFVKQDTEELFKSNPYLRKLANTITDAAGRFTGKGYYPTSNLQETLRNTRRGKVGGLGDAERLYAPSNKMSVVDWDYNTKTGQYERRKKGGLIVKKNPYNDW